MSLAINRDELNEVLWFGLGNIELSLGNDLEAEAYFRAIVELDAKSVAARNNLAIALARQGRFAEAMEELSIAGDNVSDPAIAAELADTEALIVEQSRDAKTPQ